MKRFHLFLLPLLATWFFLCKKNNDTEFKKQILGEWKFVKYCDSTKQKDMLLLLPPPEHRAQGFEFLNNGLCNNKLGIFIYKKYKKEDNLRYYGGEKTRYKIEDDSLEVYYPETKKWRSDKIYSITKDTLVLKISDSLYTKYARLRYMIDPKERYDKIIVSSSGCYGSCPITNISISNNGSVIYNGFNYTTKNGLYTSKISGRQYLEMENNFKKAGISKLENDYQATHTDDQTITVTFIKNNRIYKTISDYGSESPAEFQWAYRPVIFLHQHLNLKGLKTEVPEIPQTFKWELEFETATKVCYLTKSESFFLGTELLKGNLTNVKFAPKYTIEYWDGDKKQNIFTDGRCFTFTTKNKSKTIDLGYNFLEQNNLLQKFKNKKKID